MSYVIDTVRVAQRQLALRREAQPTARELLSQELGERRLVDRQDSIRKVLDDRGLFVECDDLMASGGDAGRGDDAEMPQTRDADLHCTPPMSGSITARDRQERRVLAS